MTILADARPSAGNRHPHWCDLLACQIGRGTIEHHAPALVVGGATHECRIAVDLQRLDETGQYADTGDQLLGVTVTNLPLGERATGRLTPTEARLLAASLLAYAELAEGSGG